MLFSRRKRSFPQRLTITPPPGDTDRHGLALVTVLKDEANYIEEWIRFHVFVGVRHFVIYDDGSIDGTLDIIKRTLSAEQYTIMPWRGRIVDASTDTPLQAQVVAFGHAVLNFGCRFQYMGFIDVDEFLLPRSGASLVEALNRTGGAPNVSLPWHMFGTSGHETRPGRSVLLNYTHRARDPMTAENHLCNFKCIVDPCDVVEVGIHRFATRSWGDMTANDRGEKISNKDRRTKSFYSSENIQLNHYYSKSTEEMLAKTERRSFSGASVERRKAIILEVARQIESDHVVDTAMMEFVRARGIRLSET